MRKFLFASHGYLSQGVLTSLELIMGNQSDIDIICAYTEEVFDIRTEVSKRIRDLASQDELIVITDVFGGSVNNEFMEVISTTEKKIHLISGLNLALIMELIAHKEDDLATEKIIQQSLEEAKKTMLYCNSILTENKKITDDEF